jgi:predicted transcriptional regulator
MPTPTTLEHVWKLIVKEVEHAVENEWLVIQYDNEGNSHYVLTEKGRKHVLSR